MSMISVSPSPVEQLTIWISLMVFQDYRNNKHFWYKSYPGEIVPFHCFVSGSRMLEVLFLVMLNLFTWLRFLLDFFIVKVHFIFLINKKFEKQCFETCEYLIPCQLLPKIFASIDDFLSKLTVRSGLAQSWFSNL